MSVQFEKLKVADLKKIAADYGIRKEDIDGHGINGRILGTDYVRVLNEYVARQSKKSPKKTKSKYESKTKYESPKKPKKSTKSDEKGKKTTKKGTKKSDVSGVKDPLLSGEKIKSKLDSEETISMSKSEKTISMDEEMIQQQLSQLRKDQEFLRNAFVNCITK